MPPLIIIFLILLLLLLAAVVFSIPVSKSKNKPKDVREQEDNEQAEWLANRYESQHANNTK